MRAERLYVVVFIGLMVSAPLCAKPTHLLDGDSTTERAPGAPLVEPEAEGVTPREACQLSGMLLAYLQYHSEKAPFCDPVELATGCEDIVKLNSGAMQFLSRDERAALHRKVPGILKSVYDCLKKVKDARLDSQIHRRRHLIEKKKDLVKASCATFGAFAEEEVPSINYSDPCWEVLRASAARKNSCWKSAESVCKALSGEIELENLVPPSIYDASLAAKVPIDLPEYLEGSIDGALDVVKREGVSHLNDLVSKRVLKKAGGAGVIALATFTAAAKQINMAIESGHNDWSDCLGTGNAGACFHKIFMGGIPESKAFARPQVQNGQTTIDCCYSELHLMGGKWGNMALARQPDDYLAPIENNEFGKTLCHQQDGTKQEKYLSSYAGYPVYFQFRHSRKVTVTGNSCLLKANPNIKEVVRVLEEEELVLERKKESAYRMDAVTRRSGDGPVPKLGKQLYAIGHRPNDPKISEDQRFAPYFTLPQDLAPAPFDWNKLPRANFVRANPNPAPELPPEPKVKVASNKTVVAEIKPLDLAHLNKPIGDVKLPDRDLRREIRPSPRNADEPKRAPVPPVALAFNAPHVPLPEPKLPTPERHFEDLPLPPIAPVPDIEPAPKDTGVKNAGVEQGLAFPETDLRRSVKPTTPRATELARTKLPPIPLSSAAPHVALPEITSPKPEPRTAPQELPPAPDKPAPLEAGFAKERVATPTKPAPATVPTETKAAAVTPVLPASTAPTCLCTREIWTLLGTNQNVYVCAVRMNGSPIIYSYMNAYDPSCANTCGSLYQYPQSAGCYTSSAPARGVYASPQSPPPAPARQEACLPQGPTYYQYSYPQYSSCAVRRQSGTYFVRRRYR